MKMACMLELSAYMLRKEGAASFNMKAPDFQNIALKENCQP